MKSRRHFLFTAGMLLMAFSLCASDVGYWGVIRLWQLEQMPGSSPQTLPSGAYAFNSFVYNNAPFACTNATVKPSNSTPLQTLTNSPDGSLLFFVEFFDTESALNSKYPVGSLFNLTRYTVTMYTVNDGVQAQDVNFGLLGIPLSWPNTPTISNLAAAQAIDSQQDFTLTWSNLNGSSLDIVQLLIVDDASNVVFSSPAPFQAGALNGTSTSYLIPAGSLPPGTNLWGHLTIAKPGTPITSYATGIAAMGKDTRFRIATLALPPTVAITNVFNGANSSMEFLVGQVITNQLQVSGASPVTNLDFFVDGVLHLRVTNGNYGQVLVNDALAGTHTFQAVATSSGMSATSTPVTVTVTNPPLALWLTNGSVWRYYAAASPPTNDAQGRPWTHPAYDDSSWPTGQAELGYGDISENNPERTLIDGGPATNRYPTIYFRRTFTVADPSSYGQAVINLLRDDGAVVYLNGIAVWTNNISATPITYSTFAAGAAPDDGTVYQTQKVDASVLSAGANTVAVEVHQSSATSSDLSFDLMIWGELSTAPRISITSPTNGQSFVAYSPITLSASADANVTNVIFLLDGTPIGSDSSAPFTLTLSSLAASPGQHQIVARAMDSLGRQGDSAPVTINVVANPSPLVSFSRIVSTGSTGFVFRVGQALTNVLDMSDDGQITNVQFYVDETLYFQRGAPVTQVILNNAPAGTHLLQVVVFDNVGQSGVSWTTITVTNPPYVLLITNGSTWRYYAAANPPSVDSQGRNWTQIGYNETAWPSGAGELGFGDMNENNPERTVIDGGPATNRYPAVYFRHTFTIGTMGTWSNLVLNLLRDDGAVVYLNGVAVWTNNFPGGPVGPATLASLATDDGTVYQTMNLNPTLLRSGTNVVAVEVHQNSLTSSDLSFDLMLWAQPTTQRPVLQTVLAAGRLSLNWQHSGYRLQQSLNLTNWTDVPDNPQGVLELPAPPPGGWKFYRLAR